MMRRINVALLTVSMLVVAVATVIWVHEAMFAVPQCPGGANDCPASRAHYAGARMIGWVLALAFAYLALWLAATRHAGCGAWLPLFWACPALLVVLALMLIG